MTDAPAIVKTPIDGIVDIVEAIRYAKQALQDSPKWLRIAKSGMMNCQESRDGAVASISCPVCQYEVPSTTLDWSVGISAEPGLIKIGNVPGFKCPSCESETMSDATAEALYVHSAAFAGAVGDQRSATYFLGRAKLYRSQRIRSDC